MIDAIGWTLVHFVWQAILIAGLLWAALAVLPSPRSRYAAACVALGCSLAAFGLTLFLHLPSSSAGAMSAIPLPAADSAPAAAAGGQRPFQPTAAFLWLVPLWVAGVAFFQLRTVFRWAAVRRVRTRCVCPAAPPWQARLQELSKRLCVERPVALLESGLAQVPSVMGYLRPAIVVPAGLLASMPPSQVEAILLHELAHIRRHDYLVNLLQSIAEGLLFYHPAVWWISGVIRAEREHCCDDLAVAASNGPVLDYATALAALEHSRWNPAELAATGGNVMHRIRRLLSPPPERRIQPAWAAVPVLLVAVTVALLSAAPPPQGEPQQSPYTKWLNEDVVYIIDPREREAFLRLQTDEERQHFIGQFWLRRDPTPGSTANEFKEEHYRRIAYANQRFGAAVAGWRTDRGRIYIVFGPPDEIESHPAGKVDKPPYEQWLYYYLEGIGTRVIIEYIDATRNGDYRMTKDPNGGDKKR